MLGIKSDLIALTGVDISCVNELVEILAAIQKLHADYITLASTHHIKLTDRTGTKTVELSVKTMNAMTELGKKCSLTELKVLKECLEKDYDLNLTRT